MSNVKCRYCGEDNLLWREVEGKWRLFGEEGLHVCSQYKSGYNDIRESFLEEYPLVSKTFVQAIQRLMEFGAERYGDYTWLEKPLEYIYEHLGDHMQDYQLGEFESFYKKDLDSGMPVLYHIAARTMMLIHKLEEAEK